MLFRIRGVIGIHRLERIVGEKDVACPDCWRQGRYKMIERRTNFHILSIPIFDIWSPRILLRCSRCGAEFDVGDALST